MINGTGSNLKKMTYNNSNSGKSTGRHSYSGNHHNLGPNHLQSAGNNPISNNAMAAAMMNPSLAAAMINPYAMSGLAGQPPNRHHQQLNYVGFPFPSASDSLRPPYFHAQSGHAPYQNSRMPSTTSSSSPPVTSSGSIIQQGNNTAPTNGSTSVSSGNNSVTSSIPASGVNVLSNSVTNGNGSTTPDKSPLDISSGSSISKTNLYIRGLTPNTTDKDLHSLCSPYGTIISTKAILDKETNKCRGYGFVDFEHPLSAENAVKSLLSQGVQAQMAKCTDTNRNKNALSKSIPNEHDPTNLYIANLPLNMTEADLEAMLSLYGSVVSTRILKDSNGSPRGVGFARMESKEKCDAIISLLNGKMLPGSKDTLLVKFADGGNKKKHYKNDRYRNDVDLQMSFDSTNLATNGVPTQLLPSPLGANAYQRAFSATSYQNALQANPWLHQAPPQYIMQPQMLPSNMDPNTALQYSPIMHQLTAQMSHLQLGGVSGGGYMPGNPHAYGTQAIYPPQLLQSMPLSGEQQEPINPSHSVSSGSASGEEQQHSFQQMCYNQQK